MLSQVFLAQTLCTSILSRSSEQGKHGISCNYVPLVDSFSFPRSQSLPGTILVHCEYLFAQGVFIPARPQVTLLSGLFLDEKPETQQGQVTSA